MTHALRTALRTTLPGALVLAAIAAALASGALAGADAGQPLLKGATLGETEFTFTRGGHEMQGACYARIDPDSGIFRTSPSVVLAPPNETETATGVLLHMAGHARPDAQWQAKMTRVAGEFADKVLRNHAGAMAELQADYKKCINWINATAALWRPVLNPPGHKNDPRAVICPVVVEWHRDP